MYCIIYHYLLSRPSSYPVHPQPAYPENKNPEDRFSLFFSYDYCVHIHGASIHKKRSFASAQVKYKDSCCYNFPQLICDWLTYFQASCCLPNILDSQSFGDQQGYKHSTQSGVWKKRNGGPQKITVTHHREQYNFEVVSVQIAFTWKRVCIIYC